jgi:hypothetical protein
MSALKLWFSAASILLLWLPTAKLAAAGTFDVATRVESPPETAPITCYDVTSPLGAFTFVAPRGWRVEVDPIGQRLRFHARDESAHLEIAFCSAPAPRTGPLSTNALRQQVLGRFPQANILDQFPCYTASQSGLGCDVDWKPGPSLRAKTRFALVPCSGGTLEFSLTSSPEGFPNFQPVFGSLLTSFSRHPSREDLKFISSPGAERPVR